MYNWNSMMKWSNKKLSRIAVYSFRDTIEKVISYIKEEYKKHPQFDEFQLKEYIMRKNHEEEKEYIKMYDNLSNDYIYYLLYSYLKNNPEYAQNIYDKIKDNDLSVPEGTFNYNLKTGCTAAMKQLVEYLRNNIDELGSPKISKQKKQEVEKKILQKTLDIEVNFIEQNILKLNIEMLSKFYENLIQRYNLEEKYTNNHIRELLQLGLKNIASPKENIIQQFRDFWSENNLSKMNIDELSVINMFWQNKRAKELIDIYKAFSIIDNLKIYGKIVEGKKINISDEQISNIMQKLLFLDEIAKKQYDEVKLLPYENQNITLTDETENFINDYEIKYKMLFDKLIPESENDMETDFINEYQSYVISSNAYQEKTNMAFSMIMKLLDNKTIKNWGIIEDVKKKDDERLLIGFDLEGFNMPVRLHVERNKLLRMMHNFKKDTLLPLYQGQYDFSDGLWIMKSHILYNVDKDYKKELKVKSQEYADEGRNGRAISHLLFIADNKKIPPHFREKVPNSNSTAQVKRFVNINTQERYVLKQGKMITEGQYQKMFNIAGDEENNGER